MKFEISNQVLPVIPFDEKPIIAQLDEQLKKYEIMVFQEDDMKSVRATLKELNDGIKAIGSFRLDSKKQFLVPIDEFDAKCKAIEKRLIEVKGPIQQIKEDYEAKRTEDKRIEVQVLIDEMIESSDLDEVFATKVEFKKDYLKVSMKIEDVEKDLIVEMEKLSFAQEMLTMKREIIEMTVFKVNQTIVGKLSPESFYPLLDVMSKEELVENIKTAGINQLNAEDEAARLLRVVEESKVIEEVKPVVIESVGGSVVNESFMDNHITSLPNTGSNAGDEIFVDLYEIEATEYQFNILELYMENQNMKFTRKE